MMKGHLVLAGCILLSLMGCSGDGPEDVDRVEPLAQGLQLVGVATPTKSVYRKGEPIELSFNVRSFGISSEDVVASFELVQTSQLAALESRSDAGGVSLGDFRMAEVRPGLNIYSANFTIPNDPPAAGDYVILAAIDPARAVEGDEDFEDNLSRGFSASFSDPTTKVITIEDAFVNDLAIEGAEVGEGFLLLEAPAPVAAAAIGALNVVEDDPIESNAVGFIDVRKLGADNMGAIIQVDVIVDGVETPAFMWQGDGDFANEAIYEVPSPNELHFVPWDIRLSDEQRAALFAAYDESSAENSATFRFRIQQTSGAQDENPDNNSFELEVPYRFFVSDAAPDGGEAVAASVLPEKRLGGDGAVGASSGGRLTFDRKFSSIYGDRGKFAVGLYARSYNHINGPAGTGRVYNTARVDGYAFNRSLRLAEAIGNVQANARNRTASYRGYMQVFGRVVLDQSASASTSISRDYALEWREERTFVRTTFFVGPIPLGVSAGAAGTMGFGAGLSLGGGVIEGYGNLFSARLDAYAEGGVNIGIASAGIGASLLLISNDIGVSGRADLSRIGARRVALSAVAQSNLRAIEGEFYLFARYRYFHFCCSFPEREARLTLYRTGALFNKNWRLLSASRSIGF